MTGCSCTPPRQRPHSEANPYHQAIFLHGLIKAALHLVEDYAGTPSAVLGTGELLTIIEERAGALAKELDAAAFCDLWPELDAWLTRDPTLGLDRKVHSSKAHNDAITAS